MLQEELVVLKNSRPPNFMLFGFSSLGSLSPEAEELLSRIYERYSSHD